MRYALIDSDNRVVALEDVDDPSTWTYPDDLTMVEADGFDPLKDLAEYVYSDGAFEWVEPAPGILTVTEVIKAIYTAMPALTTGIVDSVALRMVPYLPDYSSTQTYTVGCLAIKDGSVQRKTLTGWRVVE